MDDKYFITGSRDKTCKLWTIDESTDKPTLYGSFSFGKVGVTAVAFAPNKVTLDGKSVYLIAVGLETGLLQLWVFSEGETDFTCVSKFPEQYVELFIVFFFKIFYLHFFNLVCVIVML